MSIRAEASIASKVGFASHQNAVPLLRELTLFNDSDTQYEQLTLSLTSSPEVIEPRTWVLDRLAPWLPLSIRDRDIKLNVGLLSTLTESVQGELTLTLTAGDRELLTEKFPVSVLARNEWGGQDMEELLPAFVMPNDPAIDKLLKATSEVLRRAGKPAELDGYRGQSRTRCWELASALWSAICSLKLSYALPPASFESCGQKVRTPSLLLSSQLATCLDSSLLFASALEQLGLNPLIMLIREHAFVGLWLQPQEFSQLVTDDVVAIRKRVELKEMVVFETTLATCTHPASFSQAVVEAERKLQEELFESAVDVRRARMQKIRPLSLEVPVNAGSAEGEEAVPAPGEGFEEAPLLPGFDIEVAPEAGLTAANRLVQWQRKLLDLTTRNRLLHVPESAKGVRLVCANPAELEDKLAEGKWLRVAPLPDLSVGGRDAALYEQQSRENLLETYARQALARGEVVSAMEEDKLGAALIELSRKMQSDLDEGGANTLFLAIGFLRWKKSDKEQRSYSAPLILLPVRLDRKSAGATPRLGMRDEEPRFNLTLLELLRNDFALTIQGLDGALPTDDSGIDVEGVWNIVRHAVRDMAGFEVVNEVMIGNFSFAKYLMWKDLSDRADQLKNSPLVRYLIERGSAQAVLPAGGEFSGPAELDEAIKAEELFLPLPADSSQIAAVVASAKGRDFVLDGPPGTGKSQTIANMIAHNLALGRRVLFVAEKKAALDVVYRRLAQHGLGEFCLELHSNKTSSADFLRQLSSAWDVRDTLSAEAWQSEAQQVQRLRDRLNGLVGLLHQRWPNGLTLHQSIGRVVRDANPATPILNWPAGTQHDEDQMTAMRDVVRRLALNSEAATTHHAQFAAIGQHEWTNTWQASLVSAAHAMPPAIDAVTSGCAALLAASGLPVEAETVEQITQVVTFCQTLLQAAGQDLAFLFAADAGNCLAAGRQALALLAEMEQSSSQLSVRYPDHSWQQLEPGPLTLALQEADKKFWFLATSARKKLGMQVKQQAGLPAVPDLAADLPRLVSLHAQRQQLQGFAATLHRVPGWNGLQTDRQQLGRVLDLAETLRAGWGRLASSPQALAALRQAVQTLVLEANDMLAAQGPVATQTAALQQTLAAFTARQAALAALMKHAGAPLPLPALRELAQGITLHQTRLKAWCDWCRVRQEALAWELDPLVAVIEQSPLAADEIAGLFETAYARWFAAWVIDADPRLHNFVPAEHTSDIDTYRQQTDRLSVLSVRYIRARLCGLLPDKHDTVKEGGFALLKHELQKSRRHKAVRQMAAEMGDALSKLAPCMLMSPLSVAQFLPADQAPFDLVIFDEASQIAPWDAIGVMARGKQVIVAGDPRQMPPTSFFSRGPNDSDEDTGEDMESILDECLASGMYNHSLTWHYRSRHESLITFSNHRYYDSNLITFPSAQTRASTVEWRRIDGVYSKGSGRHNQKEAEAMVAETVKRLLDPQFVASGQSIGIITLNTEQQRLVSDLLDLARQRHPQIERFFAADHHEPVVVKNLETVQGDERDLIMLGIGYGPTTPGDQTMSMNFGPLNRDGGWRRLNVAVTRARQEMLVFSSFDPSMIDLNRTSARAVHDLRHFLEFAARGPLALAQAHHGSVGGYDSPFEEAVANGLRRKGWQVVPQIGVSRFRIDLGIVHPDSPGDYLVGVECDGATYHSAATARDRDKVRSAILQGLGWTLLRLWSTDWWIDKEAALERLHQSITALLEDSRAARLAASPRDHHNAVNVDDAVEAVDPEDSEAPSSIGLVASSLYAGAMATPVGRYASNDSAVLPDSSPAEAPLTLFRRQDLADMIEQMDWTRFHEPDYDGTLLALIRMVLQQEAPMLDSQLVQRIARAHGFGRAGRAIRERVLTMAADHFHLAADRLEGEFVWMSAAQQRDWQQGRLPADDEEVRSVDEIACEELIALARGVDETDRVAGIARKLGIRRVTASVRERLEAVLALQVR